MTMLKVETHTLHFHVNMDPIKQPATAALERMKRIPERESKRARLQTSSETTFEPATSCAAAFDMVGLLEASKPVQESLSFPLIEWSLDDDAGFSSTAHKNASTGKRCLKTDYPAVVGFQTSSRKRRSTGRLLRSIALGSHLSLLESNIEDIHRCRSTCSMASNASSSSHLETFNPDEWLKEFSYSISEKASTSPMLDSVQEKILSISQEAERLQKSINALPLTT